MNTFASQPGVEHVGQAFFAGATGSVVGATGPADVSSRA
jgi:hypothetical protein